MDYFPNVDAVSWFAHKCWPQVLRESPHAEFRIVGGSPVGRVRRLAKIRGVTVIGEVESVAAALAGFDVSVAPLRIACGVQNKVLEAMAASKPVVLTAPIAATLGAAHGRNCLAADDADRFARAVGRLLNDRAEGARIGQNGRRLVETCFRWPDQLRRLELIVTGSVARTARAPVQSDGVATPVVSDCAVAS
jgi:glycosyltransferase involved in cell wall biosynthesis